MSEEVGSIGVRRRQTDTVTLLKNVKCRILNIDYKIIDQKSETSFVHRSFL